MEFVDIDDYYTRATEAFEQTWGDYYDWDEDSARQILSSLQSQEPSCPDVDWPTLQTSSSTDTHTTESAEDNVSYWTYDADGNAYLDTTLAPKVIEATVIPECPPYPQYQICTPISRSIMARHSDVLKFLPYADDDRFPTYEYLHAHTSLQWLSQRNPDCKLCGSAFLQGPLR